MNSTGISGNGTCFFLGNTSHISCTVTGNLTYAVPQAVWSVLSADVLASIVIGGGLNLSLLFVFIWRRTLRNSFSVYLINVLLTDIINLLVQGPLTIIDKYNPSWTLGLPLCLFQNYIDFTYQSYLPVAHALIALNRVWAVTFPFSYRSHHSAKTAFLICLVAWVLTNIGNIPVAVVTTNIKVRTDGTLECNCDLDGIGVWSIIWEIFLFDFPIYAVILAYPIVCYKSFFKDRKPRVLPQLNGQAESTAATSKDTSKDKRTSIRAPIVNGKPGGFLILTLMTLNVAVCLLPKETYYTITLLFDIELPGFYAVADVMQRLAPIVDPILIVLGNTELRKMTFGRLCRHCKAFSRL